MLMGWAEEELSAREAGKENLRGRRKHGQCGSMSPKEEKGP